LIASQRTNQPPGFSQGKNIFPGKVIIVIFDVAFTEQSVCEWHVSSALIAAEQSRERVLVHHFISVFLIGVNFFWYYSLSQSKLIRKFAWENED